MKFQETYPTIALLIGDKCCQQLDQDSADLTAKDEDHALKHFSKCIHKHWCALNTTPECQDEIKRIESSLALILASEAIDEAKLRSAFAAKAVNPDQFDQLLGEIATAAACASNATLTDLEWKTGKGNCDADVRCEIDATPINLEITLRTDSWSEEVAVHDEDIFDTQGNQIVQIPVAKSRRTMTDRQWDDLHDALRAEAKEQGTRVIEPTRVSSSYTGSKQDRPKTVFVSSVADIPEGEAESKAFCADGDNPRVESITLQERIAGKAAKFNPDGFHLVVLATLRPNFPSEHCVFDAVFGQTPQLANHGLFESGLHDEICGVLYLPAYQQLDRVVGANDARSLATLFPNHNAQCRMPENLESQLADVFGAKIRRGWIANKTEAE